MCFLYLDGLGLDEQTIEIGQHEGKHTTDNEAKAQIGFEGV